MKLKKTKSHAFGKDIYLLGQDKEGINYWLEEPKWDCGWYWGFGYIETYINNGSPKNARNISSHQHATNFYSKWVLDKGSILCKTPFTKKEKWELSELFEQFYLLRKMADFCYKTNPGCHIQESPIKHGDFSVWNKKINNEMIPKITNKIIEICTI